MMMMRSRLVGKILPSDAVNTHCAIDVLLYFHRHPNMYVSIDWLSARVGYPVPDVEAAIDALTTTGVIAQQPHANLSAVMYRLAAPQWSPGSMQTASIRRWRRQIRLLLEARERCLRAAVHAARTRERLDRTATLLATISAKDSARA